MLIRFLPDLVTLSATFGLVLLFNSQSLGQSNLSSIADSSDHSIRKSRLVPLSIGGAVLYTGSLAGLYSLWYSDYEQTRFHFFNDNDQWLQMDKVGHAMTAYYLTEVCDRSLQWSGVDQKQSILIGSAISFSYLGVIEVFDGFSAGWGFSTGDFIANGVGIGLYASQELLWDEQRVKMRFNFIPTSFAAYRPDVLGSTIAEQSLKDYNGQAYWLSTNPHAWMNAGTWPKWLNLAVGYSATGMTGGSENVFPNLLPGEAVPDFERKRQFYLSLDLDLHGIEAKRNWFKAFRSVFGFVKIPAPAIGFDSSGRVIGGIR